MTGGATSEETAETTPRGNARPSAAGGWRAVLPGLLVAFIPPLTGCANNAFDHLAPLLKVQDGTPMDSSGRYLVDFGSVAVGLSAVQPLTVLNDGRAPMTLDPAMVTAPFSAGVTTTASVAAGGHEDLSFGFAPTQTGPAQQIVTLTSNGGRAVLVLSGTGIRSTCVYNVTPAQLDFGTGVVGQVRTLAVQFANLGSVDCALSNIQISPTSDPAFSLADGQPTAGTATTTGGSFPIAVSFAPTLTSAGLQGTLTLVVGPQETTVTVPLTGAAVATPCAYLVQPTQLDFSGLMLGQSATKSVSLTATTATTCAVSDVQIESGSDPSFVLGAGQLTSGAAAIGDPFLISATFTPSSAGVMDLGRVLLHVGPPDTIVEIPLRGESQPCLFHVAPTEISFGSVTPGHSASATVQVVSDGPVVCSISSVTLDPAGNPAYSLAAAQPTSGTASTGSPFSIAVKFAPTGPGGGAVTTHVLLNVGPPSTPVQIPVSGTPTACPDPNPDGTCPVATAPIYIDTQDALFTFDAATSQTTALGTFNNGVDDVVDIGIDTAGNLIALAFNGDIPTLYAVNATTAAVTQVGVVSDPDAVGLTFLADGTLVVAGDGVEVLDPTTFAISRTIVPAGMFETSGDVVGLPDGSLYWSVVGPGNDMLIKIDPATGATTNLGALSEPEVFGLAYANGKLYGFTGTGDVLVIDPVTAACQTSPLDNFWSGATANPTTWSTP